METIVTLSVVVKDEDEISTIIDKMAVIISDLILNQVAFASSSISVTEFEEEETGKEVMKVALPTS